MKRSEIEVGGRYSNGKGSVREVLDFPTNMVSYKVLDSRNSWEVGIRNVITARSFASWAKSRENMLKAFHMNDIDEVWIGRDKEEVRAAYMANEDDCQLDEDEFYELTGDAALDMEISDEDERTITTLREELAKAEEDYTEPLAICCDANYA